MTPDLSCFTQFTANSTQHGCNTPPTRCRRRAHEFDFGEPCASRILANAGFIAAIASAFGKPAPRKACIVAVCCAARALRFCAKSASHRSLLLARDSEIVKELTALWAPTGCG